MPDVLTHVLVGYVVGSLVAEWRDEVGPAGVTLVMAGALSPDFVKVKLLVPAPYLEAALGLPFSWAPIHAITGAVVVALVAGLLVGREYRRATVALVALGAATHLFLDGLLLTPSGYAARFLVPFGTYRAPAGMLYLSSDRWPAAVAGVAAACIWAWRRYRTRQEAVTPSAARRR
jgi:hypothetical protein